MICTLQGARISPLAVYKSALVKDSGVFEKVNLGHCVNFLGHGCTSNGDVFHGFGVMVFLDILENLGIVREPADLNFDGGNTSGFGVDSHNVGGGVGNGTGY